MRGSEENGINGISGKHPCGRAYRSAHFEKYLVARKRLEIYSKGFVVTRNDGGPHPCGSAPKPFSLTPRQYLTRKTVCSHPESKAHVLFCPYSSSKSVPNFQCDTKANTHANDRCQFQDFSPTTISDRLTLHKTYSGPCSPPTGQNFRGCSVFFLRRQISRVARTGYYLVHGLCLCPHYEERRNQTGCTTIPDTKLFQSPIQML